MFEPAPALLSHPLFSLENVILTPHCGGCSQESPGRVGAQGCPSGGLCDQRRVAAVLC